MDAKTATDKTQFGIGALFALTACVGAFCALATWVFQSESLGTLDDIPVLIAPTIPMIGFGLFVVPVISIGLAILLLVLVLRSRPRSFAVLIFFGFFTLAIFVNSGWWDNSLRLLFAMTLSAIAMLAESIFRNLPKRQIVAAVISVCVCIGYYVFLLSAVVCASI